MRAPLHPWLLAAYRSPGRVFVAHTHIGCSCLGSFAALRTGCGAQQPPHLGCGRHCTAGCWRPTIHRGAYSSHTNWLQPLGLSCCTEDRLWRTITTPPWMRALLHRLLLAAYLSQERVFVAHTNRLQLLELTCCTVDRLWRRTAPPPRMRALLHRWLLAAYRSSGRAFVAHTDWLQLLGLSCCTEDWLWRTTTWLVHQRPT